MNWNFKTYIFWLITLFFVGSCAQINALEGGAKDNYAPRIDSAGTYPLNGQTNFTGNEVVLKFSEYIALNNTSENILITPQLKTKPTYSVKNKKLTITFNEPLEENTTYSINFNHAITDITEKNDSVFQYVFSTGDFIDSLSVFGNVKDAFTNKPAESFLVGLFSANTETNVDSIPFLDLPLYITQTNKNGDFEMNYLKEGRYFIYTIQDVNKNLKLDPAEKRGFLSEGTIEIAGSNSFVNLSVFEQKYPEVKLLRTKFEYPGKLTFIFNQAPIDFEVNSTMDLKEEKSQFKDSLVYWLANTPSPKMIFYVNYNDKIDTIKPFYKGAPTNNDIVSLALTTNLTTKKLLPLDTLKLVSNEPILSFNAQGIHCLSLDSSELAQPSFEIQNLKTLYFTNLNPDTRLIKIDSGAVQSFFNHTNTKEEWISVELLQANYFGTLILNIDSVFQTPVIVQILDDKNKVVEEVSFSNQMIFNQLLPGKYQVRLIFDSNQDGEWTTGSLLEGIQPEKIIYNKELIDVKSNWEKEVDWTIIK